MSNLDKAVEVLREAYREPSMSPVHACDIMADALEAAGLLAPDLPEPYPYSGASPFWYEGTFRAGISSTFGCHEPKVTFTNSEPGGVVHMDDEAARELALMLLAAADYAEKDME